MRKSPVALIFFSLFFLFTTSVQASSFVTVTREGKTRQNVLGDSTSVGTMTVQSALSGARDLADATLSIIKEGEKSLLTVQTPTSTKEQDVTKLTDSIVEIEQSQGSKTIKIGKIDDNFGISQSGITALTSYPIHIDAASKTISVATNSGERIIAVMPNDALETLVRANIVNTISQDGQVVLGENENGELTYSIPAERNVNLFNVHTVAVQVNTTVSATSGKVLKIDEPQWLKFFGFLFS